MKKAYSKGLKYQLSPDKNSYLVMGIGTCTDKDINIPPSYRGKPVSEVWHWAFEDCNSLTSVTIGSSVTSIGIRAFSCCTGLTSVTIPDSVTNIGYGSFYNCTHLTYVTMGSGVTSIEPTAFCNCSGLTSITIPESVTNIRYQVFSGCSSLMNVTIPKSVTSIGDSAFYGCNNLVSTQAIYKAFKIGDKGNLVATTNPETEFKIGEKTYCTGALMLCRNGIHYCTNLFDIFNYYNGEYGVDFIITECEVSDESAGHNLDFKRCARWVKPIRIIPREEVIDMMNGKNRSK